MKMLSVRGESLLGTAEFLYGFAGSLVGVQHSQSGSRKVFLGSANSCFRLRRSHLGSSSARQGNSKPDKGSGNHETGVAEFQTSFPNCGQLFRSSIISFPQ